MLNNSKYFSIFLVFVLLDFVIIMPVFAQMSCSDIKYGNSKYHDKMDELAKRSGLPDNYWSRYHEDVVSSLCSGNIKEVDSLVDNGYVKSNEAQAIAKVLGKTYKPKVRSEEGKSYGYSKQRFIEMGACSACADNIAQHYTKTPNSRCGKLAKQALEGNPDAVKALVEFPDYCQWKY